MAGGNALSAMQQDCKSLDLGTNVFATVIVVAVRLLGHRLEIALLVIVEMLVVSAFQYGLMSVKEVEQSAQSLA
jgi:hypothetical protein